MKEVYKYTGGICEIQNVPVYYEEFGSVSVIDLFDFDGHDQLVIARLLDRAYHTYGTSEIIVSFSSAGFKARRSL